MQTTQFSFRVILAISVCIITILSIQEVNIESSVNFLDKVLHFLCFSYLTLITWLSRILNKDLHVYVIVLAYGILIEIVQRFLPYRSFEYLDIFADFVGVIAGLIIIKILKNLYPKY
tara:strand:- start:220 stop:570 length:351 start_codon:yes stop_codon:yes gene_type:complete